MTMFPKPGIIRLKGKALAQLRIHCFARDEGQCQNCGIGTFWEPRFDGDPIAFDMAHKRNKRMYGDVIGNVEVLCHSCHMRAHAGGEPCPPKPQARMGRKQQ
jgi:5-methylcytosine-specific restriction endonuclease McrA